jgi:hypothetical protein
VSAVTAKAWTTTLRFRSIRNRPKVIKALRTHFSAVDVNFLGFFDTSDERGRKLDPLPSNISLQRLEGKSRGEIEEEKRKDDAKKRKHDGPPPMVAQMNNMDDATQISKRKKLMLPEPQVGEDELHQVSSLVYSFSIRS